jgi:hypothetical protein
MRPSESNNKQHDVRQSFDDQSRRKEPYGVTDDIAWRSCGSASNLGTLFMQTPFHDTSCRPFYRNSDICSCKASLLLSLSHLPSSRGPVQEDALPRCQQTSEIPAEKASCQLRVVSSTACRTQEPAKRGRSAHVECTPKSSRRRS